MVGLLRSYQLASNYVMARPVPPSSRTDIKWRHGERCSPTTRPAARRDRWSGDLRTNGDRGRHRGVRVAGGGGWAARDAVRARHRGIDLRRSLADGDRWVPRGVAP